ncbi:hypothetical protein Btru_071573 [Bulinus truncatus]|nr:hypothetical protein Btru_071573 [Bulinus truncatus]
MCPRHLQLYPHVSSAPPAIAKCVLGTPPAIATCVLGTPSNSHMCPRHPQLYPHVSSAPPAISTCVLGTLSYSHMFPVYQARIFSLRLTPTFGPIRLNSSWTDRSLVSCMANCIARFTTQCLSVMFNNVTLLCSAGSWLSQNETVPTAVEGQLYVGHNCNEQLGFRVRGYGATRACVLYDTNFRNYSEAAEFCASLDSFLYTVRTTDKLKILQGVAVHPTHAWVGLDDLEVEGRYVWADNGDVIDPALVPKIFQSGQPDNYNDTEDCTLITRNYHMLNDYICSLIEHTVCERNLFLDPL